MSVINQIQVGSTTYDIQDAAAVPTSRTVNGKSLNSDISLTAADVGAVPTTRTINGHALSANISLTASDVSAATTTSVTNITELKFTSGFTVTWTASSPHSTDTNSVYPNRGAIALTGVTASMHPQVTFGVANAISGDYSPICECYAGGVYIWSKNTTTPTISSILVHK